MQSKYTLQPEKWIERYADKLYSFALVRLNNAALAEDMVQETFLSALKAAEGFHGDASEKTWLVAILKRKIIDHYRKASTKREVSLNDQPGGDNFFEHYFEGDDERPGHWRADTGPQEWNSDFATDMGRQEFQQILQACLDKLPHKTAAVFVLKNIDDRESAEICNELGITSSNYWVLMHRAKVLLRDCLEKNWFVKGK